jgi:hypothetical protein
MSQQMMVGMGAGGSQYMDATGGTTREYNHPDGNRYRSHEFSNPGSNSGTSGTFAVSELGQTGQVDFLVIGGGGSGGATPGGGGHYHGGGGGAGGACYRTGHVLSSAGNYPVTVGAGGNSTNNGGNAGSDSGVFGVTGLGG